MIASLRARNASSADRADECFSAWKKTEESQVDTPIVRDIIWRVRAEQAASALVKIISNPELSLEETNRYFRSLEYHKPEVRTEAMKKLLTL